MPSDVPVRFLSPDFLARYANKDVPFGGDGLGEFVYTRTYSRWLPEKGRREFWGETVQRTVEASMNLYSGPAGREELVQEAEDLYDAVWNLRLFPSGRSLWIAGTESSEKFPESNFNCAHAVMDSFDKFCELFLLLMVGTGFGCRILPEDVSKLPDIRTSIGVVHEPYDSVPKSLRIENTHSYVETDERTLRVQVGDSKEGWVEALHMLFGVFSADTPMPGITQVAFDYSSVRPAGERLVGFGGQASGHEALRIILDKTSRILSNCGGILTTVDALDIANIIGEGVVCGGVRRTSELALGSPGDLDFVKAKSGEWYNDPSLTHRSMSNNSVMYEERPDYGRFVEQMELVRYNGEPGMLNAEAARRRRPNFSGVNPCGEVLSADRGMCNLSTVNVRGHFTENGYLDAPALEHSMRLSTRLSLRMTNVTMSLTDWDVVQKRDRLLGVSLTGWLDMLELFDDMPLLSEGDGTYLAVDVPDLEERLARAVHDARTEYASEMGVPVPLLSTTIKPEGTLSQLPSVSQGIHRPWSPYFIRRVRISASDPLARTMLYLGYPIYPEVNQWDCGENDPFRAVQRFAGLSKEEQHEALQSVSTWVVEFVQKSDAKMTSQEEPALDQLARYFEFQRHYTDHNTSVTIYVGDDEWEAVTDKVYANWDDFVGISFLPKSQKAYALAPYEEITKEEYERRVVTQSFDRDFLDSIESMESEAELLEDACASGACPVR